MTKILAFDSMFLVNPFRKVYMAVVKRMLNQQDPTNSRLILYRLDQDNLLLRDKRNISGMSIEMHQEHIDAMAIKFYIHLKDSGCCSNLSVKDIQLYDLYTRQVKLKLVSVLKCAIRLRKSSNESKEKLVIITDSQTISVMREAFLFLNYEDANIIWQAEGILTSCITINSLVMRVIALSKMLCSSSYLPDKYYYKHVASEAPTVIITMPKRRPMDFFSTYVEEFSGKFNIVLYSHGALQNSPDNFKAVRIKRTRGIICGLFNLNNLCFSLDSYLADILLIFKDHASLIISLDIVDSMFHQKVDVLINRQQTNVLENYLANQAKERGVYVLGDIFEEIFYCDSAICSDASQKTESLELALVKEGRITYKGGNSLIAYRLKRFREPQPRYLHDLLQNNF